MRSMSALATQNELPEFTLLELNGMTLTDPNYAYSLLHAHMNPSSQPLTPAQAETMLESHFSTLANKKEVALKKQKEKGGRKICVVLMDELDQMVTSKQSVMYNFFNWPNRPNSDLVVIAIANTMDLPERLLSNKISSRLGLKRVRFEPYTFQQLTTIIQSRLAGLSGVFDAKAIEFCARKVSAVSGDARRALDICRRAAEINSQKQLKTVDIESISETIKEMTSAPAMQMIMTASLHQKIFLHAILLVFRETGLTETTFGQVSRKHVEFCRMNGIEPARTSDLAVICLDMAAVHIILSQAGKFDLYNKIRLNVSEQDVQMAFRMDSFMKTFT